MSVSSEDFSAATKDMMARTVSRDVEPQKLVAFIERQPEFAGRIIDIELDHAPRQAGSSSGTQLFDIVVENDGERSLQRLVFRYDTGAAFFSQYDMAAQFEVMAALHKVGYPVPAPLWLDRDGEIYGAPAMIMERVEANAPHVLPFKEGPIMDLSPAERRELVLNIVKVLARLHKIPLDTLDIPSLHARGGGATPVEGEIRWGGREIEVALEQAQLNAERLANYDRQRARLDEVAAILLAQAPRNRPLEIVHADPGFVNFMYRGAEVASVLDWEVAQLGYGESDISYVMAQIDFYHLDQPVTPGVPSHEEIKQVYALERGGLRDWEYNELFSAWRMANYVMLITSRLSDEQAELEQAYLDSGLDRMDRAMHAFQAMKT